MVAAMAIVFVFYLKGPDHKELNNELSKIKDEIDTIFNKGVNQMWMEELNELLEYMKNKYMY